MPPEPQVEGQFAGLFKRSRPAGQPAARGGWSTNQQEKVKVLTG
jgi:hypothetical protein